MIQKLFLILLFVFLIPCCGCIQKIDSNHNLASLVETERSFAETSREKGIRDAFLTYLADDAIVFRPRPVKAKPLYAERPKIPGSLSWYPIHADVSLAGDLGYTTGPYEYRNAQENQQADECGFYVSIWKKQANDNWQVMIDAGIDYPCPDTTLSEIINKKQPHRLVSKINPDREVEAEKAKLFEQDFEFSSQVASEGIVKAYQDYSADNIRYYRMGKLPVIGNENVCNEVQDLLGNVLWKPMASDVAKSGDLGYTYGIAELMSESGEQKANSYLRIWKKNKSMEWKIVLDLANPILTEMDKAQN